MYNSVFDDFKEDLIEVTSDGKGTGLTFAHNTIGRFGGGAFTGTNASNLTYLNTAANAVNTFFDVSGNPINGNSAGGTDPKYSAYVRDASSLELIAVDPRPASDSPLWTGNGATLQTGAPVTTTYRGAFGSTNWAAGWTKLSQSGVLQGGVLQTDSYILTLYNNGNITGGTITKSGTLAHGTNATLTATPLPGYVFGSWSGDASGSENPTTILMDSNKNVGATFVEDTRDPDSDGLTNYQEIVTHGTNPDLADTDGDGVNDGDEVGQSTNPNNFIKDINVTADITTNTTWTADNAYILDKSIFVKNGATLTIQPGTTILGTKNVANNTYGSLIISRNGTIMAEGTAEAPIVMTAKEDRDAQLTATTDDDLDPATDGGLYGGLIILGSAPINYYTGPTTNANENSIEGFPAGSTEDIKYGGTDAADNSGVVKYMSLRFGGYEYTSNKEINGLTMGGVGSGTTIENVEIVGNTDDGMEIFGGTVNTKRIAVAFCQDDSFDLDEGHQGFHQFWFAIQNPTGTLGDRGGEWDGGNGYGTNSVRTGTPNTTATIYNATFIGDSGTSGGGNSGIYLDDYFAGQLHNSVLHQFSGATIAKASDGVGNGVAPQPSPAVFSNNTWGTFGLSTGLVIGAVGSPTGTGNSAVGTDPKLTAQQAVFLILAQTATAHFAAQPSVLRQSVRLQVFSKQPPTVVPSVTATGLRGGPISVSMDIYTMILNPI